MIENGKVVLRLTAGEAEWIAEGLAMAQAKAKDLQLADYERWWGKMATGIREQATQIRNEAKERCADIDQRMLRNAK
jgi:hypothetical protein